nr:MAG TPA: hypothetical protein [Caudoviricetes sp.]
MRRQGGGLDLPIHEHIFLCKNRVHSFLNH